MKELNLLLLHEKTNTSEAIFSDFCFDNIQKEVFPEDAELFGIFCETLRKPSDTIDVILERRRILEDFISHPNLAEEIDALCDEAKKYKITLQMLDNLGRILENTLSVIKIMEKLNGLLTNKSFRSQTLRNIRREPLDELSSKLKDLCSLSSNCVTYNIEFSSGFKLKSAAVVNTDCINNKRKKDISFGGYSMTQYNMQEIGQAAMSNLCSSATQINRHIQSFFTKLKREISFYLAALKLLKYLETHGLCYCWPEFAEDLSFGIAAKGLYDLSLAAFNKAKNITPNDFDCKDGRILVVTGLNQGGKTTFLRSVGIAQLFAQAGLFVPAEKYTCSCFKGILTHFPKEEDRNMDFGKLAEELTRLRNDFPIIADGGLALFNESFATTTPKEGAEIAVDVLRALSLTGSTVFFVTHLYELATKLDDLNSSLFNGYKAVSMITEPDKNNTDARTFKIIRGEPLKEFYVNCSFSY